ncbi:hypothetical protein GCM10028821_13510 [Hymenobacter jeollabukensis]
MELTWRGGGAGTDLSNLSGGRVSGRGLHRRTLQRGSKGALRVDFAGEEANQAAFAGRGKYPVSSMVGFKWLVNIAFCCVKTSLSAVCSTSFTAATLGWVRCRWG